jgi:hypothetical protein
MYKPSPFVAHMQEGIIFYAHSQNFHLKFETPWINGNAQWKLQRGNAQSNAHAI